MSEKKGGLFGLLGGRSSIEVDPYRAGLQAFWEAMSRVSETEPLITLAYERLRETFGLQRACLVWVSAPQQTDPNATIGRLRFRLHERHLGEVLPPSSEHVNVSVTLMGRLVKERQPFTRREMDDPAFPISLEERTFFKSLDMAIFLPLVAQADFIGVLCLDHPRPNEEYSPNEVSFLKTVSSQLAVVLRNARLVEDLRRRERELSNINSALQASTKRLEQLDGVKTDFITIASHELRTPLAQVRGYSDIIDAMNEQGLLDPEQLGAMLANLRKATDRMEELIRNMLDVSQLDVNAMDLRFAKIKIENVIKLAIDPLAESARSRRLSLTVRGLRGLPEIDADMKRLVQAFQNIIVNAIKFTPDGGHIEISGELRKTPDAKGEELLIMVKDSGIGIAPQNLEIIFEKFVRTQDPALHSTGKTKFMGAGPGLGLTIARGVIDGHGGRVWAQSAGYDPQTLPGSIFYVALPISKPEDATGAVNMDKTTVKIDRAKLQEYIDAASKKS